MKPTTQLDHLRADHPLRLVVADDRARSRSALRALLGTCLDLVIVGEAANGAEVIRLVEHEEPDVVIMDLRMPVIDGLQATIQVKARWPRVHVLMLSVATEAREEALASGADAFVTKGDPEDTLLDTIRHLGRDC